MDGRCSTGRTGMSSSIVVEIPHLKESAGQRLFRFLIHTRKEKTRDTLRFYYRNANAVHRSLPTSTFTRNYRGNNEKQKQR